MSRQRSRTWMARVKYALDHHAAVLMPVVDSLLYSLAEKGIMHRFGSRLGGANSNYLDVPGRRFHFKGIIRPVPGVEVRERVRGPVLVKLQNERDVLRWVASL
jgi:hypothetical protein